MGISKNGKVLVSLFGFITSVSTTVDHSFLRAYERGPFFVMKGNRSSTGPDKETIRALENPDKGKDGESQGTPVDEARGGLASKDSPQGPSNGNGGRQITFWCRKGISGGSAFKEEKPKEDKNLCPNTRRMVKSIDTECLECGQDDKNSGPSMIQREGEMNEEFIGVTLSGMILFDDIVDVCDCGADEKSKNKGYDVMMGGPQVDVNRIEHPKKRESPRNAINNNSFAPREELVDDRSQ